MNKLSFKKTFLPILLIVLFVVTIRNCSFHSLPSERLQFFKVDFKETYEENEYQLTIKNPVNCPNRLFLSSPNKEVNALLKNYAPILIEAKADTTISIKGKGNLKGKIKMQLKLGDSKRPIPTASVLPLPYPQGKSYKLLQGNNSNPTHNHSGSRYAFDFTMNIGDTITSSQDGYVVGVIDGYSGWGYSDKWKPYSNQVMIYDTSAYLFTMYGHLMQHGSLVTVGEYVTIGQPIALSGKTGKTSEEHLHFNVLSANSEKGSLISFPLDSIGNYKVKDLTRYQVMKH